MAGFFAAVTQLFPGTMYANAAATMTAAATTTGATAAGTAGATAAAGTTASVGATVATGYVVGGAAAGLALGGSAALITHNILQKRVLEAQNIVTALNTAFTALEQNLNITQQEITAITQQLHTTTEASNETQQRATVLQTEVNKLKQQMAMIEEALTIANSNLVARENELNRVNNEPNTITNNPVAQEIYNTAITQMALLKSKYEQNALGSQELVKELPPAMQAALDDLVESADKRILTEQALAKTFHEAAEDISILRQNEEKTAKEDAEAIILKIRNITLALEDAKNDNTKNQHEILLLETNLKALRQLRKEAFINRAIKVYVSNMKKPDTYAGKMELQAIADIFNCDIKVWKNDDTPPVTIKSTVNNGHAPDFTLNIITSFDQATGNIRYQPMSEPLGNYTSRHASILEIPFAANCLFVACIKALQLTKMQTELAAQIDTPYLDAAAYSLRLEVCDYLSNRNEQLHRVFANIIAKIYDQESKHDLGDHNGEELSSAYIAYLEAEKLSKQNVDNELPIIDGSIYNMIDNELSIICRSPRLLNNICKIIEQHYPEITDDRIRAASNTKSISSDSSLGDIEDFDELDPSKPVLQDFMELEEQIKSFFMGGAPTLGPATTASNQDGLSIARRYLATINDQKIEYIGGPIEIRAIAELYNLQIYLEVFTGQNQLGKPAYVNEFKKTGSKNGAELLHIALINANMQDAKFIRLSSNHQGIDAEAMVTGSVYKICSVVIGKDEEEIKNEVYEYIHDKVNSVAYNPFSPTKQNDGISAYFDDYIFKGYKGIGDNVKEFDLLPKTLCNSAKTLRAIRQTLFKISNTLIEQLTGELAAEITEWTLPFNSLARYNDMHLYHVNGYPQIPPLSMLLALSSVATATANAAISENFTSASQQTYNTLQSLSLAGNLIGGVIFCLNNYIKEKNRSHTVRAIQDAFIVNLPFEKIDASSIRLHRVAGNVVIPSHINDASFDGVRLRNEWTKDEYSKLSFRMSDSDNEIFITKQQHIHMLYKARNQHTIPIIALFMSLYAILTPLTIVDVGKQLHDNANQNPSTSNNETTQASFSSPTTANTAIAATALLSVITMIVADNPGPKRVCEHELSAALYAISKSYHDNVGTMSDRIAILLQYFSVNGTIADSFTTIPQMINIQKSIFKTKQALKMYAQDLQQQINASESNKEALNISSEAVLLTAVKDILTSLESFNAETLYQDGNISEVNQKINSAIEKFDAANSSTSKSAVSNRGSAILFSSERITKSLRRLSGVLKFTAAISDNNTNEKKQQAKRRATLI